MSTIPYQTLFQVENINMPRAGIAPMIVSETGTITRFDVIVLFAPASDVTFNVTINGVPQFAGAARPTIAAGSKTASKTGLSIAVTKGDVINLDVEIISGVLIPPIFLQSDVSDGIALIPFSYLDTDGTLAANSDAKIPSQKAVKTYAMPLSYLDTNTSLTANSDSKVASQKAVKTYIDALLAANDAQVYKGAIDCSTNPNYPAADAGHTYRVSVAGKIGGASGPNVEAGDWLICFVDSTAAGNHATVGANWNIIQANLDGAIIGPSSAVNNGIALFDGTTGKLLKDSGKTISTDGTFAADSDDKLPTEKAVKTYVAANAGSTLPSQTGNAGKYLTTNGTVTSWDTPAGGSGGGAGILVAPTTTNANNEEFDGTSSSWTKTGTFTVESFNDKEKSAFWFLANPSQAVYFSKNYTNAGNFSVTFCFSIGLMGTNNNGVELTVQDGTGSSDGSNLTQLQWLYDSGYVVRTNKRVSGTYSFNINTASLGSHDTYPYSFLHVQRSTNNWGMYYSFNGRKWFLLSTIAVTMTVASARIVAFSDGSNKLNGAFHWARFDWLTL